MPAARAPPVIKSTMWEIWAGAPRIIGGGIKNEGVGEHVRTRFHMKLKTNEGFDTAGEIANH